MKTLSIVLLFLVGCASYKPPIIYEPEVGDGVESLYSNGVPIASCEVDSLLFLVSLDRTEVLSKKYYRLWVLCQNLGETPYLLDPTNLFALSLIRRDSLRYDYITVESPSRILHTIDSKREANTILAVIGGALEIATAQPTKVTDPYGGEYTVDDVAEKRKAIVSETGAHVSSISRWYTAFRTGVNSGILRKNTLFQDNSVHGYVYLPIDEKKYPYYHPWKMPEDYTFIVRILTPERTIRFAASLGE